MRSTLLAVLGALVLLTLGACASSGPSQEFADIDVQAKANPTLDLGLYRTYAWAAAGAGVRDPDGEWTRPGFDIAAEIQREVDTALRARGRTEVTEDPDMLAVFAVGVDMKSVDVIIDPETSLVGGSEAIPRAGVDIALVDPVTRRAVWIARAVAEVDDGATTESAKRRLQHAIAKMFADFPR